MASSTVRYINCEQINVQIEYSIKLTKIKEALQLLKRNDKNSISFEPEQN